MKVGESKRLVLKILTKSGQPAKVDGLPVWENSDAAVFQLDVEADGMAANLTALASGVAVITASCDADLGAGVRTLSASKAESVDQDEADSISIEDAV